MRAEEGGNAVDEGILAPADREANLTHMRCKQASGEKMRWTNPSVRLRAFPASWRKASDTTRGNMTKPYLRDLLGEAVELLKKQGQWVIAGVETNIAWPKQPQVVPFGGMDFILRPLTNEEAATVCLNTAKTGISPKDARDFILRFGSALSWTEGHSFEVFTWVGGSHAIRIGRRKGSVIQDFLNPNVLPNIPNDDAAAAMAFYREGISSDSNFYAFLSLYKVISFIHRDGRQRGAWIEQTLPNLKHEDVQNRVKELVADGINPSEYLRDSGRHAIAHAEKDVFVNPDRLVDHERIYRDLPIMRALARKAIEERFQLYPQASQDAPKETSIPGFERICGPELIKKLLSKEDLEETNVPFPDDITALVRRGNSIISFTGLLIDELQRWENGVGAKLVNQDSSLIIGVGIDFRHHTLVYEPQGNCGSELNKASRSSIELRRKLQEFNWLYYGNGHLELWDAKTDELLGKSEAYIPLNMFLDHGAIERSRTEMQKLFDAATED
jgi:hypothetical protein